jgi:glycosyltransferase involved in cell wall biosynthesis
MHSPLRFCMVTTFYPPYHFGGDGIFVQRLSNELARQGHSVDVIHCLDAYRLLARRDLEPDGQDHPNIAVHRLKSAFGALSPLATQQTGFPFFKAAAIDRIINQNFDVIHYHNISLLGPKVLHQGHAVKLYTMHEYWLVCPTHVLFKFNEAACATPQCLQCTLLYKRPPQWWRYTGLLGSAVNEVDCFIAPSRFSAVKHREMGLSANFAHLPHFVTLAENDHSSRHQEWGTARPYFLFVGRLEKLKGLQTIIPIFRQYDKAQLWIAGTGSYEPTLRRLAGDNDRIRFLGQLSEPALRQLYGNALAVIAPSLCYETFGQVVVEAFSQHTPALVRNLGAMPELIEDSGGGVSYNNDAELVEAMESLVANAALRREWGERGYQAYLRNWTAEVHLDRYLALVQKFRAAKQGPVTHSPG